MVKFQQFVEGYFKGFIEMNPDGELTKELIDLIYWDDLERREEEKRRRIIVCRHDLFSPVDPIVYNELKEIDRVRVDFELPEKMFTEKEVPVIDHIKLREAKNVIKENSIVDKFVKRYFGQEGDINLVVYAGSEMIGPSVQLAEVAGCITKELLNSAGNTFLLFDIFSGSSATALPTFKELYKWVNDENTAYIIRLDDNRPEVDYLEELYKRQPSKDNDLFFKKDKFYLKAQFDFERACISCLLYTSPIPRDLSTSRMPSSA